MKYFFYSAWRLGTLYLLSVRYFFTYWYWSVRRYLGGKGRESYNRNSLTLLGWCIRRMLEDLGATYIKVGQIMSTRPDIFPDWLLDELKKLQDNVPPFDPKLIAGEFEIAFGKRPEEIFERFNQTPIASASVAQVHEAWLKTGEHVAVKIRRPGMKLKVEYDLAVMRIFAKTISIIPTVAVTSPVESVEEFGKSIIAQLDLRIEAANNRRFRKNFEGNKYITFPVLYEDYCAENILTMSFVGGYKIDELDKTDCDPKELARHGLRAIFQMIYKDGFVHADLHPGNFRFFDGDVVTYMDLGMVAEITDEHRDRFIETFMAMAQNDGKKVARIMADYAPWHGIKEKDWPAYEAEIAKHISDYLGKPLNEIEVSVAMAKIVNILRKYRIRVDAAYTVVNVGLLVAEGNGRKLYPEINMQEELMPYLTVLFQDVMKRRAAQAAAKKAAQKPAEKLAAGA